MTLPKLLVTPEESNYTFEDGQEVVRVELEGGAGRYRRDVIGAASLVRCRWLLSQEQYFYLRAFYRSTVLNGSLPFLIDLLLDIPTLTEHTAYFKNEPRLNRVQGHMHQVQADLEVEPVALDSDYYDAVVMLFEEGVESGLFATLEELVNVSMVP
jgi:hypothetical protein